LNCKKENIITALLATLFLMSVNNAWAQMEFVENKGQWDTKINYKSEFSTGAFFLENRGFTVLLNKPSDVTALNEYYHGIQKKGAKTDNKDVYIFHSHAYNVTFLGAAFTPVKMPDKPLNTYNNYFIGNDEKKWAGDCKVYTAVTYKNVYPNIDVRYYSTQEKLKYDFIVHPGGNPAAIAMRYDGVDKLSTKNNELIIQTSIGEVKELAPYTYQANVEGKKDVNTKYKIRDNVVTFDVGDYDATATLIIDPQLVFSTLTGSSGDNWGYTATPGPDGSFFAGGISINGSYPVLAGSFQTQYGGGVLEGNMRGHDIAIFKFSPNGSLRLYATYLGGSGNEQPHSMITDAAGNLIVAGRSSSSNFPTRSPLFLSGSNNDIIITKFNAAGTALIGSVKIGGNGEDGVNIRPKFSGISGAESIRRNYGDDARSEVILDASNNVYLASCTQSSNFPVTGGAAQTVRGSGQEGVILKLNSNLSALLFSSYFGGNGNDACFVISINPVTNNVYVAGATESNNLLGNTTGTISPTSNGDIDGFITIITPDGSSFVKTTYIGTSGKDLVYGLKFDKLGFPYINGTTTSGNWIIKNAGYNVPGAKQFISKLKPDLSDNIYSTVFGTANTSDPNISPTAFLVDRCENVYVSGWGGGLNSSQNYSTGNTNGLLNVNPLNVNPPDGNDFYFFVLQKDAVAPLFGSNFGQVGGTAGDHVDGGTSRFDANGIIYQAVCANCSDAGRVKFPTTGGVWQGLNQSAGCNQAAVKVEMNFSGIGAEVQSEIGGEINDTLGCISLTVNFKDLKAKGEKYYWDFGDPSSGVLNTETTINPIATHIFNNVGVFKVRLIAEDVKTCNQRDTSYITIRTGRDRVLPKFDIKKLGDCTSKTFGFINKSASQSLPPIGFFPQTFVWDFGDGSPVDTASFADIVTHPYASVGTYKVILKVIDPRFCNSPQSDTMNLRINDNVKAKPTTNELGCAPYIPVFKNVSDAGLSWKWELFDALTNTIIGTSTDEVPTFSPLPIGQYKYRLIAYDSSTCNKIDTSNFFTITVVQKPIALFSWAPIPPEPNVPVRFTNSSSFADTYLWEFGDGETSTAFAPVHEYNATGIYTAVLTAISRAGCAATDTMLVSVIVNPLLDVPNAFTPGRFGINSVVNVRGFGIGKMDWRVYNRWGQMIFRSDNKRQGWDGTYRGKLQPVDTYSYSLDVEFTDGKKLRKTGDITLLR
jgi:gliding motility-associated-like protein